MTESPPLPELRKEITRKTNGVASNLNISRRLTRPRRSFRAIASSEVFRIPEANPALGVYTADEIVMDGGIGTQYFDLAPTAMENSTAARKTVSAPKIREFVNCPER